MTAPITPDERAEWRALADAATPWPWDYYRPHHASGYHEITRGQETLACQVSGGDAAFIAAARTAVPRLLDALDAAEAEIEAAQRQHNAAFESVRASAREHARAAESWEARTHEALDQRDKALADVALLRPALVQWEEGFEEETDRLDAIVERQRDRLRAREEQVRRLRAEAARLHALVADQRAATAPAPTDLTRRRSDHDLPGTNAPDRDFRGARRAYPSEPRRYAHQPHTHRGCGPRVGAAPARCQP